MPRIGWVAVGAALGALVGTSAALPPPSGALVLVLTASLVAGAAAAMLAREAAPGRIPPRALLGLAIGCAAIGVRLLLAVSDGGAAGLPIGRGPWQATVVSVGSPRDAAQRAVLRLDAPGSPLVAASLPRYPPIVPGDLVSVAGPTRPPGLDDYGRYLLHSGIAGTLTARSLDVRAPPVGLGGVLEGLRRSSDRGLAFVLPEPEAGLASGILVGLRERVDRSLADDFTAAGVTHVVAISGWNIAIVGAAVAALLRGRSRRVRAVATLFAIAAYTAFAGASASVVRAAVMAAVVLLARESGRRGRASAALGWAVVILLVADPAFVGDVGLQLSALATAGLIAWSPGLTSRLRAVGGGRLPQWLAESLGVSLAAQAATLPLILVTFGRLSLVSPAANLVVVPLVPPAMATGAVAMVAGWFAALGGPPALATAAALPAWLALTVMVGLVRLAAAVPYASVTLDPTVAAVAGCVSALALGVAATRRTFPVRLWRLLRLWRPLRASRAVRPSRPLRPSHSTRPSHPARSRPGVRAGRHPGSTSAAGHHGLRRPAIVVGLALAVVVVAAAARPDGRVHVVILDVGQADAILVEGERGGRLLVDGAADPEHLLVALDARIPPWDRRIDLVLVTHPHEDHLGGLPVLLERYRVGRVLGTGRHGTGPAAAAFDRTLAATGRRLEPFRLGGVLTIDDVRLQAVWPPAERVIATGSDGRTVNDSSIVLLGAAATRRFLLLGDAEDDVDPQLVAAGLPHVDLLKVAHHGSATATSDALLRATRPALAAMSVGAGNRYGHPSRRTLARLAATTHRVLRTDRDGTIDVALGPGGVAVTTRRGRIDPIAPASAAVHALYHRLDVGTRARRRRRAPSLPGSSSLVLASLARGRRGRGLARPTGGRPGRRGRPAPRRERGPPARRRQARSGPLDVSRRPARAPR